MSQAPNVTDPGRIIAHRGASQVAPENTLAAFRAATAQGARWVEFDVSLLGDGTAVLSHDADLDRCTDATGPLAGLGRADLEGLDAGGWKGAAFRGERMPVLEEALEEIARLGLWANLEMKPHDADPGPLAAAVAAALGARPWTRERVIVSSFSLEALEVFRTLDAAQPLAVLFNTPPADWRAAMRRVDAAALHLNWRTLRQSLLTEAMAHGLDVRVYTANDPRLMAPFRRMGLTGIVTDHPPLYLDDPDWYAYTES